MLAIRLVGQSVSASPNASRCRSLRRRLLQDRCPLLSVPSSMRDWAKDKKPGDPHERRKLTWKLDEKPGDSQDNDVLTIYPDHPMGAAHLLHRKVSGIYLPDEKAFVSTGVANRGLRSKYGNLNADDLIGTFCLRESGCVALLVGRDPTVFSFGDGASGANADASLFLTSSAVTRCFKRSRSSFSGTTSSSPTFR